MTTRSPSAAKLLSEGDVVVVLGRGSLAESADATLRAAAALAGLPNVKFLSALRRGNVHGALEVGLAPGVLPGRVALDDGRAAFTDRVGRRARGARVSTRPASSRPPRPARSTRSCSSVATR